MVEILRTSAEHLPLIQALWADGEVMRYVGFPDGLMQSDEEMLIWFRRLESRFPDACNYSIFEDGVFCGESFYSVSPYGDAALDIKLLSFARGRGIASAGLRFALREAFSVGAAVVWVDPVPQNLKAIALYERLGFERAAVPEHLSEQITDSVYMELSRGRAFELSII